MANNQWGRLVKQNGAEIAKQRYASAPVLADLKTAEPLKVAGHANRLATKLANGLLGLGIKLAWKTETNMVWPLLTPEQKARIENLIFHYEETDETGLGLDKNWLGLVLLRFVTSWATTEAEIEQAIAILQAVLTDNQA